MSTLAILLYAAVTAAMARYMSRQQFSVLMIGTLFLLGLAGYYGLFFGAAHFMGRYLSPVSPLLAILTVAIGMVAVHQWGPKMMLARWSSAMIPIVVVVLVLGLNTRTYLNKGRGSAIDHIQVKQWVEIHVAPEIWVGAVQTGVLGFFHDRTVNLDGKVNPYALAAKIDQQIPHYVVESPIQYLADWGIAGWIVHEPLNQHFEVMVDDPEQNLGVLRRVTPVPPSASLQGHIDR
ncbi:conserved hypothetical protein [Desulfurivibrio alkaliphilus AHT 2]|uniref:Uncharacterized protein n=2 Tax=Desulfurivibrio alkaliphilus TaxID=427923 RepID=D6Z4H5_DESAT|nr:conserved hypothetical protein [Desulfurivibrio alkaliphilus AHT 2]